jgi:hypothetical protein
LFTGRCLATAVSAGSTILAPSKPVTILVYCVRFVMSLCSVRITGRWTK